MFNVYNLHAWMTDLIVKVLSNTILCAAKLKMLTFSKIKINENPQKQHEPNQNKIS